MMYLPRLIAILFLFFILGPSPSSFAMEEDLSLVSEFLTQKTDEEKEKFLNRILNQKEISSEVKLQAVILKGGRYAESERYGSANVLLDQALTFEEIEKKEVYPILCYYLLLLKLKEGLEERESLLVYLKTIHTDFSKDEIVHSFLKRKSFDIALMSFKLGDKAKALHYFKMSSELVFETNFESYEIILKAATICFQMGKTEEGKELLTYALDLADKMMTFKFIQASENNEILLRFIKELISVNIEYFEGKNEIKRSKWKAIRGFKEHTFLIAQSDLLTVWRKTKDQMSLKILKDIYLKKWNQNLQEIPEDLLRPFWEENPSEISLFFYVIENHRQDLTLKDIITKRVKDEVKQNILLGVLSYYSGIGYPPTYFEKAQDLIEDKKKSVEDDFLFYLYLYWGRKASDINLDDIAIKNFKKAELIKSIFSEDKKRLVYFLMKQERNEEALLYSYQLFLENKKDYEEFFLKVQSKITIPFNYSEICYKLALESFKQGHYQQAKKYLDYLKKEETVSLPLNYKGLYDKIQNFLTEKKGSFSNCLLTSLFRMSDLMNGLATDN